MLRAIPILGICVLLVGCSSPSDEEDDEVRDDLPFQDPGPDKWKVGIHWRWASNYPSPGWPLNDSLREEFPIVEQYIAFASHLDEGEVAWGYFDAEQAQDVGAFAEWAHCRFKDAEGDYTCYPFFFDVDGRLISFQEHNPNAMPH